MAASVKIWCLHCETTSLVSVDVTDVCPKCGAGEFDVEDLSLGGAFFPQAYPDLEYEDIEIDKHYPLYKG